MDEIKNIVRKIVELKTNCNKACWLHGREPIFHPSSESEKLASELPLFMCKTDYDFKIFIEMIFKFILEASGNGKRLPKDDPRIDSMEDIIKELRNHFSHDREHGKRAEVRRKYKRVGDIYEALIGKRVPREEEDWRNLQIAVLQLVVKGLQRIHNLLSEPSFREKIPHEVISIYEDNRVFIFGKKPILSRTAIKKGFLSALADIPVFIPTFTWVPPPQLGDTQSAVYITSRPPYYGKPNQFANFVREVEKKWRESKYLLETYGPLFWTISEDNRFTYGCGADNLAKEVNKHKRASLGAIMHGCFGEHYDRTCFLVLYGYKKGQIVKDVGVDIYLSCIPISWEWIEDLYSAFKHFGTAGDKMNIQHFSVEPISFCRWSIARNRKINLKIIGGIGRYGFGLQKDDERIYYYRGVIVNNSSLRQLNYYLKESWNMDLSEFKYPLKILDESVISLTNPVPSCEELELGSVVNVNFINVSMFTFDAYGGAIYGIAVHSVGPEIKHS